MKLLSYSVIQKQNETHYAPNETKQSKYDVNMDLH